jgi:hypothetical protein
MMLREVIGTISGTLFPMDEKLALTDAIPDPIKSHIDRLGPTLFDGVVGNACSSIVVGLDGCGGLRMTHFFKSDTYGTGIFSVVKESGQFCLRCARENFAENGAGDGNGPIRRRRMVVG